MIKYYKTKYGIPYMLKEEDALSDFIEITKEEYESFFVKSKINA